MDPRTQKATEAIQQYAADRAAVDPRKVDKSERIVRSALVQGTLAAEDYIVRVVDHLVENGPLSESDRSKLAALLVGGSAQ